MIYKTRSRYVFVALNTALMIAVCAMIVLPFVNLIAISTSNYVATETMKVGLLPVGFQINAYLKILNDSIFMRSFVNSVFLTVITTCLTIGISLCCGYALSSKHLRASRLLLTYFLVPMYFSGGLIPYFLTVSKFLGLRDTFLALILPVITNCFYIIIFRINIKMLPKDIIESAEVDGANEYVILFRIVAPIIVPTISAFIIINAVVHWNEWFGALLFIDNSKKWPLQFALRRLLLQKVAVTQINETLVVFDVNNMIHAESFRMAALMITILPIICVYPFFQKYFIHGIIVGAVKG
jgi:putative aldouronate transport system permease protein